MVDDAAQLKKLFLRALKETPSVSQADVARACDVSDQAVNGWKSTGRIAKKHFPTLSALFGKPLGYWHGATDAATMTRNPGHIIDERIWGSAPSSQSVGFDLEIVAEAAELTRQLVDLQGWDPDFRENVHLLRLAYQVVLEDRGNSPRATMLDLTKKLAARNRQREDGDDGDQRGEAQGAGAADVAAGGSKSRRTTAKI